MQEGLFTGEKQGNEELSDILFRNLAPFQHVLPEDPDPGDFSYDYEKDLLIYNPVGSGFPQGSVLYLYLSKGVAIETGNKDGDKALCNRFVVTHFVDKKGLVNLCYSDFNPNDYLYSCSECNRLLMQLANFVRRGVPHLTGISVEHGKASYSSRECCWGEDGLEINGFSTKFPHDYSSLGYDNLSIFTWQHARALDFIQLNEDFSRVVKHELSIMVMMNKRIMDRRIDDLFDGAQPSAENDMPRTAHGLPDFAPHPAILEAVKKRRENEAKSGALECPPSGPAHSKDYT